MVRKFEKFMQTKMQRNDEHYMSLALHAAQRAKSKGDIPVGAILVWPHAHLTEHNTINSDKDVTSFAEINVLRKASQTMMRKLGEAVLYTTVEPNSMCALAASLNGIKEIIFGVYDEQNGFMSSTKSIDPEKYGIVFKGGVLANKCYEILPEAMKEHTKILNS